jgi:hypothetical protein
MCSSEEDEFKKNAGNGKISQTVKLVLDKRGGLVSFTRRFISSTFL